MQHIGYCAIYGFRIDIPYLVQDMVDMAHNMYPPDKSDITLPSSVNAEYMQANDDEILSFTSQESYWWLDTETIRRARVDDRTIKTQFTQFFHAIINNVVPETSESRQYMTAERVDVPGLAERPPNAAPPQSACSGVPHCSNCENFNNLKETIKVVHADLLLIERRVDEALRVGIESADKSLNRVGVYNILGALSNASPTAVPFEGETLPAWFEEKYPEHSEDERNQSDGDEAKSDSAGTSPATSIPEDFDPGTSESDGEDGNESADSADQQSADSADESEPAESAEAAEASESADLTLGEEFESD